MSALRPFFGYYGGKWMHALRYPAPQHRTIVEPFAGSAGYSVRYPHHRVILGEKDPKVAAVWRYLLAVTPAEIMAIPDVPLEGSVFDLAGLPEEARWLVGFWLNKGNQRPCHKPSAWMRSGMFPGSFWGERVRHTIASQLEYIRHWKISEGDYSLTDLSAGPAAATWFIDPPYENMGRHYTHGSAGIHYGDLAEWCRRREGQVIVCEAGGATWLPFQPIGALRTTRKGRPAVEAVWLNDQQLSLFSV